MCTIILIKKTTTQKYCVHSFLFCSMNTNLISIPDNFPYPFYFYGSADSIDCDVIIAILRSEMPVIQEDRKEWLKSLEQKYALKWNTVLAVIEGGYIVDTIYPKTWTDSLNNALWNTYSLHYQVFPNPISGKLKRNRLLAIYKAVRTVMSVLTRTHLRTTIRPVVNGVHPFEQKIAALEKVFLPELTDFGQRNMKNEDIWKTIAFYIGQNLSLILDEIEIYTKADLVLHHPSLRKFIYRESLDENDKMELQRTMKQWLTMIKNYGEYLSTENILRCKDEIVEMKKEIYLTEKQGK